MAGNRMSRQREYMRELVANIGFDQVAVCAAYADAEADGLIGQASNVNNKSPED